MKEQPYVLPESDPLQIPYLTHQVHYVHNLGTKWSALEVASSWVKTSPC